jgi:glycosyltransferase involved in cell wall biosynthesis
MFDNAQPRILIVAENASAKFGGEAILPLHYFRLLRARGIETWLLTHARNRAELAPVLGDQIDRVEFVPDTWFHRGIEKIARPFPNAIKHATFRALSRLVSQVMARRMAKRIVAERLIDIVHQPTPVSPKETSLMYGLGVPIVMGPMNGGMNYPPGFERAEPRWISMVVATGRFASRFLTRLMPGKLRADVLIVANDRTAKALPAGVRGKVIVLPENGVRLELWNPIPHETAGPIRFVFSGRLVDWKGVQYLIEALARVVKSVPATLDVIGDGRYRTTLEAQAKSMGVADKITFHRWVPQEKCAVMIASADVFVLPSIFECGGAVVLEAMACGLPVIATNWGGPADYLDPNCGILIDPGSPTLFVDRLTEAMLKLATDADNRRSMGTAGRAKIEREFDWNRKVDRMLGVYAEAIGPGKL